MNPVEKIFALLGGAVKVQKAFGLKTQWGASKWLKDGAIPPRHIIKACRLVKFQVTPHQLNPDMYPNPYDGIDTSVLQLVDTSEKNNQSNHAA